MRIHRVETYFVVVLEGDKAMKTATMLRCTVIAGGLLTALAPAAASPIGTWDYQSSSSICSIGTAGSPGKLIMIYTVSGASGFIVVPADQSSIAADHDYPLKVSIEGSADRDMTASAMKFGDATVLLLDIKAAGIAADAADGFALRVKLNDKVVYEKDMHGSKEAFAAFVACSKTLTK